MVRIGQTPLLHLKKFSPGGGADIYAKYEGANPTGSMKDRMALSMIEGAEKRGELHEGGKVVEYTGGSTGSSLAMVCATRGYSAHFVSSDAFSEEKLQTMRAFGATLELIPSENGKITARLIDQMVDRARELADAPNVFWTDQFNNADNRNAYHAMANEVLEEIERVDAFVAGVGTGGCISGNAEIYKAFDASTRIAAIEPEGVKFLSGGDISGSHQLEGIGTGFIPSITRMDLVDEVFSVTDEDAFTTARELAKKEGIFGGVTSGANVYVAQQLAQRMKTGEKIVTVICDSGLKYLKGNLYK